MWYSVHARGSAIRLTLETPQTADYSRDPRNFDLSRVRRPSLFFSLSKIRSEGDPSSRRRSAADFHRSRTFLFFSKCAKYRYAVPLGGFSDFSSRRMSRNLRLEFYRRPERALYRTPVWSFRTEARSLASSRRDTYLMLRHVHAVPGYIVRTVIDEHRRSQTRSRGIARDQHQPRKREPAWGCVRGARGTRIFPLARVFSLSLPLVLRLSPPHRGVPKYSRQP